MYFVTVGFHDAHLEVEVIVSKMVKKEELSSVGNKYNRLVWHEDKFIIEESIIINKDDTHLYQFRVCTDTSKTMVSSEDYKDISWEEAKAYFDKEYKSNHLPFYLKGYYYGSYLKNPFINKKEQL